MNATPETSLKGFALITGALSIGSLMCQLVSLGVIKISGDEGFPIFLFLLLGIFWTICVYEAFKTHGSRAAWLLLELPIVWFWPGLILLMLLASLVRGGGV